MVKTFKKVVVCHTNDFGGRKAEQIERWVSNAGGRILKEFNNEVTHLIASRSAWKDYAPLVSDARHARAKVVSLSWLEDSLTSPSRKPKETMDYEWESRSSSLKRSASRILEDDESASVEPPPKRQDVATKDAKMLAAGVELDKVCFEFEQKMVQDGYHSYKDETHFTYMVTLLRQDVLGNRMEQHHLKVGASHYLTTLTIVKSGETPWARKQLPRVLYHFPRPYAFSAYPCIPYQLPRQLTPRNPRLRVAVRQPWAYCLQLFETASEPRKYTVVTHYTRPGLNNTLEELAPKGSSWDFAIEVWRRFFAKRTGYDWNDRPKTMAELLGRRSIVEGTDTMRDKLFEYKLPKEKGKSFKTEDLRG